MLPNLHKLEICQGYFINLFENTSFHGTKALEYLDFCKGISIINSKLHKTSEGFLELSNITSNMNSKRIEPEVSLGPIKSNLKINFVPIEIIDLETNLVNVFSSISEAAESINEFKGSIGCYLRGKQSRPFKNRYKIKKV